jgi:methylated-DNA-[protein]-cysteine S-methyltransferase
MQPNHCLPFCRKRAHKTMILSFRQTLIGRVAVAESGGAITNLCFGMDTLPQQAEVGETELIREAFRQLDAYLAGELRIFSVPVAPLGTPFMQRVWNILCTIPYGTTVSYRDIALSAGNSLAARAVGMANNRNPVPIFIPCHRVIGSNGKLTGYRGGLGLKKALLELERRDVGS